MLFADIISVAGYAIETAGVIVIVVGSLISTISFLITLKKITRDAAYKAFRRQLGRSIILGLEFLIAGDIIRTVIVKHTVESLAALGMVIIIRTFLSITLHLEIEGRWPWQKESKNIQ